MHQISEAWLEHQRKRFTRCDAARYRRFDPRFHRGHAPFDGKAEPSPTDGPDHEWWLTLHRAREQFDQIRGEWVELRDELLRRKANFNPSQPRIVAGSEGAGRWTDDAQFTLVADKPGPSAEPPLDKPPTIPPTRASTSQERTAFLKSAAQWVARAVKHGMPIGRFIAALEVLSWFDPERPYFEAYQDPPKTLEELQAAVSEPKRGYHRHHVAEQASAEEDGFPRSLIDERENLVLIPALKHWEISGWYQTKNPDFGWLSPREYLQDRNWDERKMVGLHALRKFGVLKP